MLSICLNFREQFMKTDNHRFFFVLSVAFLFREKHSLLNVVFFNLKYISIFCSYEQIPKLK